MNDAGSTFRRDCAAAALVAAPLLIAVSSALAPSFDGDEATRLAAMSGVTPTISALTFLLAQLPLMVAFLGIGHLLRAASVRLSLWGTCLGVGGAFAHTVFGGSPCSSRPWPPTSLIGPCTPSCSARSRTDPSCSSDCWDSSER